VRQAILSLGSHCTFDFLTDDVDRRVVSSILLPRRSLLVFESDAYERLLHTVRATRDDLPIATTLRIGDEGADALPSCADNDATETLPLRRSRRLSLTLRRVLKVLPASGAT